jgi:hypothetical protein
VAAIAAILLAPSSALAQGTATANPFTPGIPTPPATTPTATTPPVITTPTTSTSGGGVSSGSAVAIAIGALVLLGGISLFIWRDARRRAPVKKHTAAIPEEGGRGGSKQRPKPRKLSPAERRRRKRGRAR